MLPRFLLAVLALLAAEAIVLAQETAEQLPVERAAPPDAPRVAVPRAAAPRAEAPPPAAARPAPAPRPEPPTRVEAAPPAADQRRAEPRGSRPRGDNPPVGTAVPRGTRQAPPPVVRQTPPPVDRGRPVARSRPVIVSRPPTYSYYYYPRAYYPYGYGAFGLGYFYYDPYRWYSPGYTVYGGRVYGGGVYGGVWRSGRSYVYSSFDIGELRLRVTPLHAQVFVDGYYAGIVDDYDGVLQSLKMESGPYHVEIVAPGYETLEFDVRMRPGQKITYRGDLIPRP